MIGATACAKLRQHDPFMAKPACPLCNRRRGRRSCPALGESICSACCGTKRRTQIACPPDCVYLESAAAHPPAVVQRRRERDGGFLAALLHGLTEPQQRLTAMLLEHLAGDRPDAPGLVDADVEQAALALAQTYETASRGIVYEHPAGTASAQRLAGEMKQLIEADRSNGAHVSDHAAAIVLRRIEAGAREARRALPEDDAERAYLSMLRRVWTSGGAGSAQESDAGATGRPAPTGLIVPP